MKDTRQPIDSMVDALAALAERSQDGYGRDMVQQMLKASRALVDSVKARAPETQEMRALRIDKSVKSVTAKIEALSKQISDGYAQGIMTIDQNAIEALNLKPNQWGASVVNTLANAKDAEKITILGQIVENGDGPSMAAILDAPAFVHGIDREMLRDFKRTMEEKHAPEVAAQRQRFKEHADAVFAAKRQAEAIAQKAIDIPSFREAIEGEAALRDAEQRLAEATAA